MLIAVTNQPGDGLTSRAGNSQLEQAKHLVLVAGTGNFYFSDLLAGLDTVYRVFPVSDLNNAQSVTLQKQPDLVVIDFSTNHAAALQLCHQLKLNSSTNHIPVVLVAEKIDAHTRLTGIQFGADECLADIMGEELVWRVRNLIQLCNNSRRRVEYGAPYLSKSNGAIPSGRARLWAKIMEVMEKNISDPFFNVGTFAREVGVSQTQLYRKISEFSSLRPTEYIRLQRLSRAVELLQIQAGSVSEIAYQVGFSNMSYFAKCFRAYYQCSPYEYIRKTKPRTCNLVVN